MQKSILIITLFIISGVLFSCGQEKEEAKNIEQIYKEEGIPIKVKEIQYAQFEKYLSFHSTLNGIVESSAFASFAERVEKIKVKVGDYVNKNDVLLTFPTDNPKAQYYQAKVAFDNAKNAHERIQNLFKSGGISRQNLDNSQTNYEVTKANWESVRQKIKVKAPIRGYVTKINVTESEDVKKDQELFTISRTDRMKAKVWLSEKEILDVQNGNTAYALWNGLKIEGEVVQVDMALNQKRQAFGVLLEFENPNNLFRCGITVDIQINTYINPQSIIVERKNILTAQDKFFVFVSENNMAKKKYVLPGNQQGLDIEITDGLKAGEFLIIEGQMLVEDSSKVKIIN